MSERAIEIGKRMAYVAGHLMASLPANHEWTGVIGPEGQREDDYLNALLWREIKDAEAELEAMSDRFHNG